MMTFGVARKATANGSKFYGRENMTIRFFQFPIQQELLDGITNDHGDSFTGARKS